MGHKFSGRSAQFGGFELWLETAELFKAGRRVKIQEKPFRVLAALLERPGEMVTREELKSRIWPAKTFVEFDQGLNVAVHKLRLCLGDPAGKPRYIETVGSRGYRFISEVVAHESAATRVVLPIAPRQTVGRRRSRWMAFATVAALAIVLVGTFTSKQNGVPARKVVAVLPLRAVSAGVDEGTASAMTYALIAALSDCGSLRVISATTSERYRSSGKSLHDIAKELNVDAVVEGSVAQGQGKLSLTAHLIDATKDRSLWGGHFEREAPASATMRVELASALARNVKFALLRPGEQPAGETGAFFPKSQPNHARPPTGR